MPGSELKARLTAAMKDAMRAQDKPRLGTIRLALAELKQVEVDERIELDDERVVQILSKMVKQRRESIRQYEDAGRQELADQESFEISVLEEFLPTQLSDEEIGARVEQAIAASGATGMQDMGKVMGALKKDLSGQADMGRVSQLVKARLSGG